MFEINKFFSEFGEVKVMLHPETREPLFLLNDLCQALEYSNPSMALSRHTSPDDRFYLSYKDGRDTGLWEQSSFKDKVFVTESGLYCLIFGSNTEKAAEFKRWLSKIVLPSIRQNGGYVAGQELCSKEEVDALYREVISLKRQLVLANARQKNASERALRSEEFWLNQFYTDLETISYARTLGRNLSSQGLY